LDCANISGVGVGFALPLAKPEISQSEAEKNIVNPDKITTAIRTIAIIG
tara:strand:+ start:181 stop:327 length:147 start_codon:yes stop_codon:yes gene_type:complete